LKAGGPDGGVLQQVPLEKSEEGSYQRLPRQARHGTTQDKTRRDNGNAKTGQGRTKQNKTRQVYLRKERHARQ
jgi:hypothetical protein